jgi:N-glycosylase/DNA lyase
MKLDYKDIEVIKGGIIIKEVKNFELSHIFDCGQCFRWHRQENGNYIGVAFERVIEVEKDADNVIIYNSSQEDFYNIWEAYFDLKRDYGSIKQEFENDELLQKAVVFGHGIRLLQQESFEITLSFIISANNRIPMIKRAIENISKRWGKVLVYKEKNYYTFPELEKLHEVSEKEFEECGTGFRAKYIKDTVEKIYKCMHMQSDELQEEFVEDCHKYDLKRIKKLDDNECHNELQNFSGIGPKVADCIMLFSMNKYSAFPVDVWVKRAMQFFYLAPDVSLKKIREFAREKFGELSGFAQQYLFYYARENNIKVE